MWLTLKLIITNEEEGFSEVCISEFQIHKKSVTNPKLFYHTLRRYFLLTYGLSIEPEGATTGIYRLAQKSPINGKIVFGIVRQNDQSWLPYTIHAFYMWKESLFKEYEL